jgi:hypothetical protein
MKSLAIFVRAYLAGSLFDWVIIQKDVENIFQAFFGFNEHLSVCLIRYNSARWTGQGEKEFHSCPLTEN